MKRIGMTFLRVPLLIALLAVVMAGCVKMGGGSSSRLPWSQPADWENQTLGIPL